MGIATDHVIESFRNDLWPDLQELARACRPSCSASSTSSRRRWGRRGSASSPWSSTRPTTRSGRPRPRAAADASVEQVVICTPDKDLGQCVRRRTGGAARPAQGGRHRRRRGAGALRRRPGVDPGLPRRWSATPPTASPGSAGWGAKSAAAVLARYHAPRGRARRVSRLGRRSPRCRAAGGHPCRSAWTRPCSSGASPPSSSTPRPSDRVDELRWTGPTAELAEVADALDAPGLAWRGPSDWRPDAPDRPRRGRSGGDPTVRRRGSGVGGLSSEPLALAWPSLSPFSNSPLAEPSERASFGSFAPPKSSDDEQNDDDQLSTLGHVGGPPTPGGWCGDELRTASDSHTREQLKRAGARSRRRTDRERAPWAPVPGGPPIARRPPTLGAWPARTRWWRSPAGR